VQRGETLSGVAHQHLSDGITMDQMMIALFQANPRAFGGNINVLHEGAVLRIPGAQEVRQGSPETAAAEVARQHNDSLGIFAQNAPTANDATHGPVTWGETLSSVARQHLSDGVTLDQMMIAVFQANPRAFGGNINVLYQGAVLRIPGGDEVRRQSPESAAAEVVQQHIDWRDNYRKQSLASLAVGRTYDPLTGGELLSITALP
jgi:pilus assembly protein FimV